MQDSIARLARRFRRRLVLLGALAAACGAPGPQAIDRHADTCARCRMAIGAIEHAGEIITAGGEVRKYDSLICLVEDYRALVAARTPPAGAWVIEYDSREWLRAEDAQFALAGLPTDHMGFGAVAARTRERAVAVAGGESGKVVDWPGLLLWRADRR